MTQVEVIISQSSSSKRQSRMSAKETERTDTHSYDDTQTSTVDAHTIKKHSMPRAPHHGWLKRRDVAVPYPLFLRRHEGLEPRSHSKAELVDERRLRLAVDLHTHPGFKSCLFWKTNTTGVLGCTLCLSLSLSVSLCLSLSLSVSLSLSLSLFLTHT